MLLVTGGAGFIGSNLIAALNADGRSDIVVNDTLGIGDKWRNIAKRRFADVVPPPELMDWLQGRKLDAVLHLGAISDTTASDGDRVLETNIEYWAAVVLDFAEIPPDLTPAMFGCARVAGWSAHILEQKRTGRLIRPGSRYIGPAPRSVDDL